MMKKIVKNYNYDKYILFAHDCRKFDYVFIKQIEKVKILKQKEEVRNMEDNNTVDLVQVQNQAKNDERSRVREISAIGAKHGLGDIATKAIEDSILPNEFANNLRNGH